MNTLLQLTGVTKSFGAVQALKGVSFALCAGEVHAVLGENGAGKSTLIKLITGALRPDDGEIVIAGKRIDLLTPASAHQFGIACIYQQPALLPDLTVAENIGLRLEKPAPFHRVRWDHRESQARNLLDRIGARISPNVEARDLSMPEQQMVEIACALGAGASIVIMDEPTSSLTHAEQQLLFDLVRDLRARGLGIIYISHRMEEIFALADRVTVLRDGESVGTRTIARLRPGGNGSLPGPAEAGVSENDLIQMMVGREVPPLPASLPPQLGGFTVSLCGIHSRAGGVRDVNLTLHGGEIVGLAGLIGAGRTELAQVLFGLTPADGGQIQINGRAVPIRSPQDAMANGIAYVPEDRRRHGVILEMAIAANMTMAIHRRLFPRGWLRPRAEEALALKYVRELDTRTSGPQAPGGSLSGGNQQKVALARWLATEPKLLILDEPTQGVDIGAKSEIHKLIRRLASEGLAVLMISSDLPEILSLSDRIAVMHNGSIREIFTPPCTADQVMRSALG